MSQTTTLNSSTEALVQHFLSKSPESRLQAGIEAIRSGRGVLVIDDEDRENEGDLIFAAETLTAPQMAQMIRDGSGIVCLCLPEETADRLELPPMVQNNSSRYSTAFTISIEAAEGVTTGVSAADRTTTIRTAVAEGAKASDLAHPGHVFPLRARKGGVLERRGHTEGSIDLARLAGFPRGGVLAELTNPDGTMARLPELLVYGEEHQMPVLTIEDIAQHIEAMQAETETATAEA